MSEDQRYEAEGMNRSATEVCEHYWAWVSPAGTSRSARICMLCHQPDAAWLNHIVEVDTSDTCQANPCVHCEFAEVLDPTPPTAQPRTPAGSTEEATS